MNLQKIKRLNLIVLVCTLLFTALPVNTFSAEESETSTITTQTKQLETYSTALSEFPLTQQTAELKEVNKTKKSTRQTSTSKKKNSMTRTSSTDTANSSTKKSTVEFSNKNTQEGSSESSSIKTTTTESSNEEESKGKDTSNKDESIESSTSTGKETTQQSSTTSSSDPATDNTASTESTINSAQKKIEQADTKVELIQGEKQNDETLDKQAQEVATIGTLSQNITEYFSVTDWKIIGDKGEISDTNPAKANTSYDFEFDWELKLPDGQFIQEGDKIVIPFLKNESWDTWGWQATGGVEVAFEYEIENTTKTLGTWKVGWNSVDEHPEISIVFGDVSSAMINNLKGIKFTLAKKSVRCYTSKGGTQMVDFGGHRKNIAYQQAGLQVANGYDFKDGNASGSGSNNRIQYSIVSNLASTLELAGDVDDGRSDFREYKKDADKYHYPNRWGQNASPVTSQNEYGMFVRDTLDPGVTVKQLAIYTSIRIPADLQASNYQDQRGGRPSKTMSFEAKLLQDDGGGPKYKIGTGAANRERPKMENSFSLVTQNNGESVADFELRVKSKAYQYGIYVDKSSGDPDTYQRTIMVYYGKLTEDGGEQKKFSELTDSPNAEPSRFVDKIKADGTKIKVPITSFAVEAAEDTIRRGYYDESYREILEDYYTLVYGDSNALGGQVPTYNLTMQLNYPRDTDDTIPKQNTADLYFNTVVTPKDFPKKVNEEKKLSNPYGRVQVNPKSALLWKIDQDTGESMNNVKFKLQKRNTVNNQWEDVVDKTDLHTGTINGGKDDKGNDILLQGGILVNDLSPGTYRFVETETPKGYRDDLSDNYLSSEQIVASKEFTLTGANDGPNLTVRNKVGPTAKYTVEHYLQKPGTDDSNDKSNYTLERTESLTGPEGLEVTGTPGSFPGWSYDDGISTPTKSGIITEDGTLVLKLYYTISKKLGMYKVDETGKPMPYVDGDPNKQVVFDVYEWNWYSGGKVETSPNILEPGRYVKLATDAKPDAEGKFFEFDATATNGGRNFAVIEKKTYKEYELPYTNTLILSNASYFAIWAPKNEQEYRFSGANGGTRVEDGKIVGAGNYLKTSPDKRSLLIYNNPKTHEFSFIKENEKSEPLTGVEFKLYKGFDDKELHLNGQTNYDPRQEGTYWDMEAPLHMASSQQDGKVYFGSLKSGYYLLMETKTVDGYRLPDGYWILKVDMTKDNPEEQVVITSYKDPPAFKYEQGVYKLPNFRQYSMPQAGGRLVMFLTALGIISIGLASMVNLRKKIS